MGVVELGLRRYGGLWRQHHMAFIFIAILAGLGVALGLDLRERRAFRHAIERRLASIYGRRRARRLVAPRGTPLARRIALANGGSAA